MKVVTFNLGSATEDGRQHLDRILREIRRLDPDVIALQQVRGDQGHEDAASTIQRQLGCYPHFVLHRSAQADDAWEGLAVLARDEIVQSGFFRLHPDPSGEDDAPRIVQWACFRVDGEPLFVFNCHFARSATGARSHAAQLAAVAATCTHPGLILGALDGGSGDGPTASLAEHGWKDAWEEVLPRPRPDEPRGTASRGRLSPWHNALFQRPIRRCESLFEDPSHAESGLTGLLTEF